jgi:galactokinase/mevalonate kinase-like predicted kinase
VNKNDPSYVLTIPDGLSVQLLSKKAAIDGIVDDDYDDTYVLMVVGTADSIKTPIRQSTLFDVPIDDFLNLAKVSLPQLGMNESLDGNDCLWIAKIHPIVHASDAPISFGNYFDWIKNLRVGDPDLHSVSSFQRWLAADKVSLKDLHNISDAEKEWKFRRALDIKYWHLQSNAEILSVKASVVERLSNTPCEWWWLLESEDKDMTDDALHKLVTTLEQVGRDGLLQKAYDVAGRAFMLASAISAEFQEEEEEECPQSSPNPAVSRCDHLLGELKRSSTKTSAVDTLCVLVGDILTIKEGEMRKNSLGRSSEILEKLALRMTELTITEGFRRHLDPTQPEKVHLIRNGEPRRDKWVISVAPARVDLAGGWSDTPPICYEYGGSVTGMAVLVDGLYPLSCRCRLVSGKTGILMISEMRDISSGALLACQQDEISSVSDLSGFREPSSSCALVKAALICIGMVTEEQITQLVDLQPLLNSFCSSTTDVRLEVVTTSLLGLGTGMGTSSILGACTLQSIAESVGIGKMSNDFLLHAVLMLEQILSSGGGWQDQAHGILPGVKTVRSMPPRLPLEMQIESLEILKDSLAAFEERLLFAYTGQTRLAKNILQHVLRRWSRRTCEIVDTVESLVKYSEQVRSAYLKEDWDTVAEVMYKAYQMKCVMAGKDSGAEPETVNIFISKLVEAGLIKGAMLCGAGGGGFLLLLRTQGVSEQEIKAFFWSDIAPCSQKFDDFSFHDCAVAPQGLTTSVLDLTLRTDSFDLSWQKL